MAFKFIVFSAFIALARAGAIGVAAPALSYSSLVAPVAHAYAAPVAHAYAAPVAHAIAAPVAVNSYSVPNYDFAYGVNDPHTGDVKNQQESRHGDVVQGSYSLIDADGTRRVVEYTADPVNGFNAVVHRQPVGVAVAAAPVAHVAAPAVSVGYSGLGYARGIGYSGALLH